MTEENKGNKSGFANDSLSTVSHLKALVSESLSSDPARKSLTTMPIKQALGNAAGGSGQGADNQSGATNPTPPQTDKKG